MPLHDVVSHPVIFAKYEPVLDRSTCFNLTDLRNRAHSGLSQPGVPDLVLFPQCGHSHSPNSAYDFNGDTRRSDMGVLQLEQRPVSCGCNGFRRRMPARTITNAASERLEPKPSQTTSSMSYPTSLLSNAILVFYVRTGHSSRLCVFLIL
jgi:hypothetical protein